MPSFASRSITSTTSAINSGSSADVGSSNNIIFGSMHNARAIATLCCCPPESLEGYSSFLSNKPTQSSSSSAFSVAASLDIPFTVIGASIIFPKAFMCGNKFNCWNTIPAFCLISRICFRCWRLGSPALISTSSISIEPADGSSKKFRHRKNVLLPPPEGPMTTTTSPSWTSRSTPRITCSGPKYLCKPRTLIMGLVIRLFPFTTRHVGFKVTL